MSLAIKYKQDALLTWVILHPLEPIRYLIRWIKDYSRDHTLAKTAGIFSKKLAELEKVPIGTSYCLSDLKKFLPQLEVSSRELILEVRKRLNWQLMALEYRQGKLQINAVPDETLYQKLASFAEEYKASKCYFTNKKISLEDKEKLKEATRYRQFAQSLVLDREWRNEFFRWTIVNDNPYEPFKGNPVEVFVKFPSLYEEILRDLSGRFSRFGGDSVRVNPQSQTIEVPVEGKFVPIVKKGPKIVLRGWRGDGKRTMTIGQIFEELRKKNALSYGDIEMLNKEGGFYLHNAAETGPYHEEQKQYKPIDLHNKEFILQFPITEQLTPAEIEKRYGTKVDLDFSKIPGYEKGDWIGCPHGKYPLVIIKATQADSKQMKGTHAFYEFLIPNSKGTYDVRSCGEYVFPFPLSTWGLVTFTARYHPARHFDVDENKYCAGREHAAKVITPIPTPKQWEEQLDDLKWKISAGLENKFGFHAVMDNCTAHIYRSSKRIYGKSATGDWKIGLWDLEPSGIEGSFYQWAKKRYFRNRIARIVYFLLGSYHGMHVLTHSGKQKYVSMHSLLNSKKASYLDERKLPHPMVFFEKN